MCCGGSRSTQTVWSMSFFLTQFSNKDGGEVNLKLSCRKCCHVTDCVICFLLSLFQTDVPEHYNVRVRSKNRIRYFTFTVIQCMFFIFRGEIIMFTANQSLQLSMNLI